MIDAGLANLILFDLFGVVVLVAILLWGAK